MNQTMWLTACAVSFIIGVLLCWIITARAAARRRIRRLPVGASQKVDAPKQSFIKRVGVMNLILVVLGVAIFLFVLRMIDLFEQYGSVPDTLITCFFAVAGGECGVMGWIKTTKERNQDRTWTVQDRKEEQALIKEMEDASNV